MQNCGWNQKKERGTDIGGSLGNNSMSPQSQDRIVTKNARNSQDYSKLLTGVRIKKELIQESLNTTSSGDTPTENRKVDKEASETVVQETTHVQDCSEPDKEETNEHKDRQATVESINSNSTSSKRRLQGERLLKRSKKFYKVIREYAKFFKINGKIEEINRPRESELRP